MRKLKNLAKATIATLILTILLSACGGGSQPDPQQPPTERPNTASTDSPNVPTPEALPTKTVPLTNLGATPAATEQPPTRTRSTQTPLETTTPATTSQAPQPTDSPPPSQRPEDLIPQDPATNDTVLLQDIYDLMDLSQFALDPTKPIERFDYGSQRDGRLAHLSTFNVAETLDHPYIFLFPTLKYYLDREQWQLKPRSEIPYSPYMSHRHVHSNRNHRDTHIGLVEEFRDKNPLVYFIYHPWFDTIPYAPYASTFSTGHAEYGPFWFGNNSTRGVLSDAIAQAMTQATYPATQPLELIWHIGDTILKPSTRNDRWEWTNWKLDGYLRTAVSRFSGGQSDREWFHKPLLEHYTYIGPYLTETYQEPVIQWEFLHPELPILKITAENATVLPLTVGDIERPEPTEYSVSFVISLQNRWASLEDPNRMLARFPEQAGRLIRIPNRSDSSGVKHIDELITTPDLGRWNFTDYMQHQLIGPVIVQINKSEVLEPGIYEVTPKVTNWDAPGHIPSDEQLMQFNQYTDEWSFNNAYSSQYGYLLRQYNVDWPLPGHILTDPTTGPGSRLWSIHKMDQNDW